MVKKWTYYENSKPRKSRVDLGDPSKFQPKLSQGMRVAHLVGFKGNSYKLLEHEKNVTGQYGKWFV